MMIDDFIVLHNRLNLVANDGFLFLEDPHSASDLDPDVGLVLEVFEGLRFLILSLFVENDLERAGVVVQFKDCFHSLFLHVDCSTDDGHL